jgi:hypothetical protein
MPTMRRIGYRCTCGSVIPLDGPRIGSRNDFEALRDKRRREGWVETVVHAEAIGGCGGSKFLQADDLVLIEFRPE